jgi:hypothetical protein
MRSLGITGCTKCGEAHEYDRQSGENESIDIGKSQRLRTEGNARINIVSVMRSGLAKIIEKECISWCFESYEADLHIAENVCCINYANTWSPKMSLLTLEKPKSTFQYFRLWMRRHIGTLQGSSSSTPTIYGNSHSCGFKTQNPVNMGHYSHLRMNGKLSSMPSK